MTIDDMVLNGTPRERIWDAIHAIEADLYRWRQEIWEGPPTRDGCGSTFCLAGWIVIRAGYATLGKEMPGFVLARTLPDTLVSRIAPGHEGSYEGELDALHVSGIAEALLGIDSALSAHLWWGNNSLDYIKQLAVLHFGPDPRKAS